MNCEHCGAQLAENAASCVVCGTPVQRGNDFGPAELANTERVGMGILGALIGALLGGASIILISRLSYIAAISGFLIALLTLKGYELLGKQLSKTGVIICIVLLTVTPLLAYGLELVWQVYDKLKNYGITLSDTFGRVAEMVRYDEEVRMACLKDLGMLYLFMILGAFSTIRNALRKV